MAIRPVNNITEARLMKTKPVRGKGYTAGKSNLTAVIFNGQETEMLLDSRAFCSIVSKTSLQKLDPDLRDSMLPAGKAKLNSASNTMKTLEIFPFSLIIPHPSGEVKIQVEFIVVEDGVSNYFILGNDYLTIYGSEITNSRERSFTMWNDKKRKKYLFKHEVEYSPTLH